MMDTVFWAAAGVVLYTYIGYPALLALWARVRPRPHVASDRFLPGVSIVVAARREAERLPARIENLLALDYPAERLEIVVAVNGSTDGTAQAVSRYLTAPAGSPAVRLVELPQPGKAEALNAAVAVARHDVIVFADARQRFARDTVRRLVRNLADPRVGAVSGELVLDCERGASDSSIGEGLGAYWRYEKALRRLESRVDSTLGATGAVYALRRAYWRDLPPGTILDDVLAPMRAVLAGSRVVFDDGARAFDTAPPDAGAETRRKTRTLAGNYQLLALEPRLLVPGANRVWVQFCSHKLARLLVPFALVALFAASAFLAPGHALYAAAFGAQVIFYTLALYGARLEHADASRARGGRAARSARKAVNA